MDAGMSFRPLRPLHCETLTQVDQRTRRSNRVPPPPYAPERDEPRRDRRRDEFGPDTEDSHQPHGVGDRVVPGTLGLGQEGVEHEEAPDRMQGEQHR